MRYSDKLNLERGLCPLKIIARHLTVDMYNCKTKLFADFKQLNTDIVDYLNAEGYEILETTSVDIDEDHHVTIFVLRDGHMTMHTYTSLKYVGADIFACKEEPKPEKILKALRNIFKPETHKTTYLKRGDFGTVTDMKPRIKTRVAPLRRIHNTGSKVIRLLAHKKNTKQ